MKLKAILLAAALSAAVAPASAISAVSIAAAPGVTEGFVSLTTFDGRWAEVDMLGDARRHPIVATVVAEPEIYVLMLAGLGAIGFLTRRRGAKGGAKVGATA